MGLRCKRCGSEAHVKNGLMRGQQRYLCKACGLNFTDTPPRGKPLALKVAAVLLYVSGLSMNRTAKLLGVSLASQPPPSRPGWSSSRPPTPRSPSRKDERW
jgi:transposase